MLLCTGEHRVTQLFFLFLKNMVVMAALQAMREAVNRQMRNKVFLKFHFNFFILKNE